MFGYSPPVPWGLVAAAVIAVCVTAGGWYVIHGLRKADAEEIRQLAAVAERNAKAAHAERQHAALSARLTQEATQAGVERERRLQTRLRALQGVLDDAKADADIDAGVCPVHCELRWESGEDGSAGGASAVPADAS